jgi:hypothetical protein
MNDDWLASRLDRLNSIVQVIITVLLNTSIAAESTCLALLSGSVLFESFIHLGLVLSRPYVYIVHTYIYKPHLLSNYYFFFWEKVACMYRCYDCCRSILTTGQPRVHPSSIVDSDDGSSLRHIYGAVIVMLRWGVAQYNISLVLSLTFYLLLNESSLNICIDRVYRCVLGKILVRNKHSVK